VAVLRVLEDARLVGAAAFAAAGVDDVEVVEVGSGFLRGRPGRRLTGASLVAVVDVDAGELDAGAVVDVGSGFFRGRPGPRFTGAAASFEDVRAVPLDCTVAKSSCRPLSDPPMVACVGCAAAESTTSVGLQKSHWRICACAFSPAMRSWRCADVSPLIRGRDTSAAWPHWNSRRAGIAVVIMYV
jgi:hypothetical protein